MGIKSFQSARKQQSTTIDKALKVKDYMTTNLITFSPNQKVHSVVEAIIKNKI